MVYLSEAVNLIQVQLFTLKEDTYQVQSSISGHTEHGSLQAVDIKFNDSIEILFNIYSITINIKISILIQHLFSGLPQFQENGYIYRGGNPNMVLPFYQRKCTEKNSHLKSQVFPLERICFSKEAHMHGLKTGKLQKLYL